MHSLLYSWDAAFESMWYEVIGKVVCTNTKGFRVEDKCPASNAPAEADGITCEHCFECCVDVAKERRIWNNCQPRSVKRTVVGLRETLHLAPLFPINLRFVDSVFKNYAQKLV